MEIEQLIEFYPKLYHMAHQGSWEKIKRHGLLSTSALLDLFEVKGKRRREIESARRAKSIPISHPTHGVATIRDQHPISDTKLERCLEDCSLSDWYRLLNSKVFLWPVEERLSKMLNAPPYRNDEHEVLTIDAKSLFEKHRDRIRISPINSGNTYYVPQARGLDTFHSIEGYPFEERRRSRGLKNALAEITIEYSLPDAREFVAKVERRRGDKVLSQIWPKKRR